MKGEGPDGRTAAWLFQSVIVVCRSFDFERCAGRCLCGAVRCEIWRLVVAP